MKKPLLEVLKDWSGLVVGGASLLYAFGFTVHWAYFRLLGLEINGQPFDFLRFAADYVTSIIGSVPQLLFAFVYYSPKLIHAPLVTSTIFSSFLVIMCFALYVRPKNPRRAQKRKPSIFMILWWGLNGMVIISLWLLLHTEFEIAKVRNVLQPVDAADIQQMQNQLSPAGNLDAAALFNVRSKNVSRVYEKYTLTQKGSPGFNYFNEWFNPTVRSNNSTERRAVYLALLLLNLILISVIIVQLLSLKSTKMALDSVPFHERIGPSWSQTLNIVLCASLLIQVFLFAFVYATLGRDLTYPVIMLRLAAPSDAPGGGTKNGLGTSKTEAKATDEKATAGRDNWTHCVYLLVDSDDEVIVYDRLNFFQVKRIPRNRILTISQLFAASPFESCAKEDGTFTPCETLWMSEQTPILDF